MSGFLDAVGTIAKEQTRKEQGAASVAPAAPVSATPRATGDGDPEARAELMDMCSEVNLLELVSEDTGEPGKQMGGYVAFDVCPVCGHRDCFRAYPDSNSWACFGGSNANKKADKKSDGGNVLDYLERARGLSKVEAVTWLRDATGHPYEGKANDSELDTWYDFEGNVVVGKPGAGKGSADPEASDGPKLLLPPWEQVRAVDPPRRAPVLIDGILRCGHVGLIAGKGKSGKSWSGIELSVAVATGGEWFGHKCARGRVMFIDPELDRRSMHNRFAKVCRAMGIDPAEVEASTVLWGLRGVTKTNGEPPTVADLAHDVEARCSLGDFALVVIDSASCFIEGDENSSVDVRRFFAHVLRIARTTGAAVFVIHHFGKNDAGDRSSIDRSRGSSVWGDSPDAPLSLTEIFPKEGKPSDYLADGERAFALEDSGLREFPGMEPLHLIFSYPVHRIDAEGITADWRPRTSQGRGGKKTGEGNRSKSEARADRCIIALLAEFVREGIGSEGITATDAADLVSEAIGETVKPATLKRYVEDSDALDVYQKSPRRWLVVPRCPPSRAPETATLDL